MKRKPSDTALLAEAISKLADALSAVAAKMSSPPLTLPVYTNPPLGTPHYPYVPYATWVVDGLCDGRQLHQ